MIVLPWPPSKLSPNARGSWKAKESARKSYKQICYLIAKNIKPYKNLHIVFHPPDRRHRDLDNMLASFKYGLDGISQAWGVNDEIFKKILIEANVPKKNGMICIYELII